MFVMSFFTHFIYYSSIFHINIRRLLAFTHIFYLMGAISRFYLIFIQLKLLKDLNSFWLLFCGIIRIEHYGNALSSITIIAIERCFATFYVIDYETKSRTWIFLISLALSTIYTQVFVIPIVFLSSPLYYIAFWSLSWAIIGNLTLFILHEYNTRELKLCNWKYKHFHQVRNVNYTLSKKYQLEENIKMTKYLRFMASILVILIILSLIIITIPAFVKNKQISQNIFSLFDFVLAVSTIAIPLYCMILLNKRKQFLCFQSNKWFKTADALKIVPSKSHLDNTEAYFNQLQNYWK